MEQLSYYVWLNAEKSAAYRTKNLYLFLAEGIDQMLAVRPDVDRQPAEAPSAATLADVNATIATWLGGTDARVGGAANHDDHQLTPQPPTVLPFVRIRTIDEQRVGRRGADRRRGTRIDRATTRLRLARGATDHRTLAMSVSGRHASAERA